jgi:hypothetical protein
MEEHVLVRVNGNTHTEACRKAAKNLFNNWEERFYKKNALAALAEMLLMLAEELPRGSLLFGEDEWLNLRTSLENNIWTVEVTTTASI